MTSEERKVLIMKFGQQLATAIHSRRGVILSVLTAKEILKQLQLLQRLDQPKKPE